MCLVHPVVYDFFQPHGLEPAGLLCPWGCPRQEYWSGLPCPPSGDLPYSGIEARSSTLLAESLPSESLDLYNAGIYAQIDREN